MVLIRQHEEAHGEKPFNPPTKQIPLFPSLFRSWPDFWLEDCVSNKQILQVLKQSNIFLKSAGIGIFNSLENQKSYIVCYEQHVPPLKLGTSFTIKPCYVSAPVLLLKLSNVSIVGLRYGPELQRALFKAGKIIPLPTRVFQLFPRCIQAGRVKGLWVT